MKDGMNKDLSGQVQNVTISTNGAASDYKVKTIRSDRSGDAQRKVLPATELSQNHGDEGGPNRSSRAKALDRQRKSVG